MAASLAGRSPGPSPSSLSGAGLEDSVRHTLVAVQGGQPCTPPAHFLESGESSDSNTERSLLKEMKPSVYCRDVTPVAHAHNSVSRTLLQTLAVILLLAVCVSSIMVGVQHLHECPVIKGLPEFLVLEGVALALRLAVLTWQWQLRGGCSLCGEGEGGQARVLRIVGYCLELTIFILGVRESLEVYRVVGEVEVGDVTSPSYCRPLVFRYALCALSAMYGATLLALALGLAFTCRCCLTWRNVHS